MQPYGYVEREGYPLAAWIWGHRLRLGQDWMEYLLEFLNVSAGFDYRLGEGLGGEEYIRLTRLGLRRFVFYDEREKTRHPFDDEARQRLLDTLRLQVVANSGQEPLILARSLLRAFSSVEAQRSWYAKSLFPAHHNLLFWEALRSRGATRYRGRQLPEGSAPQELDSGIVFDSRNFFARGGEIYYLILSAGTQHFPDRRNTITQQLQTILSHNQALGQLADIIDQTWQRLIRNGTEPDNEDTHDRKGRLGWIPDPDCPFYTTVAEDVATLLETNLDPLEMLDLLAHLLGFHLVLYIYHRAHPEANEMNHVEGRCIDVCRSLLLVDALEGADGGIIRNVSATTYREQEARIVRKGQSYVEEQVRSWVQEDFPDNVLSQAQAHFNLTGLHHTTRHNYDREVERLLDRFSRGRIDQEAFITEYINTLTELLMGDFHKNFLGVHRKLAKAVDFVSPHKGPGARFVLGDSLLKALTLANLRSDNDEMLYDDFLRQIYQRYGLIVGSDEARQSGLFDRERINIEHYNRNKIALLEKMKYAGLAIEYSDATAIITYIGH